MRYRAIRGFSYKGQRFEKGDDVIGLPAKEVKQFIKEQTIEDGPGITREAPEVEEPIKEVVDDTVEEEDEEEEKGGDDVDG